MIQFSRRQYLIFDDPLPIKTVRETVCTHVNFRLPPRKTCIFTNVGEQTDNIHIVDYFPLLNSASCSSGFDSSPFILS
jgi:hypothetical protein